MPRKAEPFFRKSTGWWYLNVRNSAGRRHQQKLVEGVGQREEAFRQYHALLAQPKPLRATYQPDGDSVWSILDRFLVHAEKNVAPKTARWYADFVNDFAAQVGERLRVDQLRVHHVSEWLDAKTDWGNSTKAGAVCAVRRAFRWATEQGHLDKYPLFGLKAPAKEAREVVLTEKQLKAVLAAVKDDGFRDVLEFLRNTGARPQEACRADIGHVELKTSRIVFQPSEAKGKKPRAIYLNDDAFAIVKRCAGCRTEGPLFRNSLGKRWTSNAIRQRFARLASKVGGVRYCAYNLRPTFATAALEKGLDPITISTLMGHADASTLARTYQHLAKNPKHLIEAAKKAR